MKDQHPLPHLCHVVVTAFLLLVLSSAAARQPLPIGASQPAPPMYSDVPETHWAYRAVEQLTDMGILTGYPDGRFGGREAPSRYELAVVGARLVNYIDSLMVLLGDEAFSENLRESAAELRAIQDMPERVRRLEAALENAASLAYTRSLEARIVALEAQLNSMLGEEVFPAAMTDEGDMPLSAADTVADALPSTAPGAEADTTDGAPGFSVANAQQEGISNRNQTSLSDDHPLYIGLSPGIVSTSGQVYLGVQAGYDRLLGPVGFVARLVFNSGARELRLSVDVTGRFEVLDEALELYGGFGVGGSIRPEGSAFLVEAPFGLEAFATPRIGLFVQLTPSYTFAPLNQVDAALTGGVNLRF